MLENVFFISMEGKNDYFIENFKVAEDVPLPIFIDNTDNFKPEDITPQNIITGIIKVLQENPDNEHIKYYRELLLTVKPTIYGELSSAAYEAERNLDFVDAISIFRALAALEPELQEAAVNLAVCYDEYSHHLYSKGKDVEAVKMEDIAFKYFSLIEKYPDLNEGALYYLGRFYLGKENYEKAAAFFEEFLTTATDEERKKEVLQALKEIKNIGTLDDDYQHAYELVMADKDPHAMGYIESFLKKYPASWNGHFLHGLALRKTDKFEAAVKAFETSLEYNPGSADIFNELGLCFMNMGDFNKSELYFSKALRINHDDAVIYHNLSHLEYNRGNKAEALKYCRIILEFNPDDTEAKDFIKFLEAQEEDKV